jgi:DNA-binding NarL/FixJ family response regulator
VTSESGRVDGTFVGRRNELASLLAQAAEVRGGRLTPEEVSVARLVATGRTNRQVAAERRTLGTIEYIARRVM